MYYDNLKFNSERDKQSVDQDGFVDLKDAIVNNIIPDGVGAAIDMSNGIEEPSAILGKPSDFADAARFEESIKNYKAPNSADTES